MTGKFSGVTELALLDIVESAEEVVVMKFH